LKTGEICRDSESVLFARAAKPQGAFERMRGLLGRDGLDQDEALLIEPCSSVHTLGMSFPIDLAFLDRRGQVRKTVRSLRPGRMAGCFGARSTLEMQSGSIDRLRLEKGDTLIWRDGETNAASPGAKS